MLVALLAGLAASRWPSEEHALTRADGGILLAAITALILVAAVLTGAGRRDRWVEIGDIRAQGVFRLVARVLAPAGTVGVLAGYHMGSVGDAVVVTGAMFLSSIAFGGTAYPLHLSGVARFVFDLVMPAIGIALVVAISAARDVPLEAESLAVPLLGGWLITFVGGWLEEAFNAERPVRLAVIGEPGLAHAFAIEMEHAGVRGHCVIGWVSGAAEHGAGNGGARVYADAPDLKCLGSVDRIRSVVVEHQIDLLVVTPRESTPDLLVEAIERCVDLPVRMIQASHLYESMHGRVPIGAINATWFAYIMHPDFSPQEPWPKRLIDRLVSIILLVALAPVFLIVAAAVKVSDGGPVLFRQRRVGAHGREFEVLKFRTMRVDAEPAGEALWASADDARVTAAGRLLRQSHLDELPQLINVLKGEMSLVGPRPERPELVAELEQKIPYYSRRVLVKPGITGWAQVRSGYGGSEMGTAYKLSHDLYYIKHRSMVFDLLTMVETIRTLVADVHQYRQYTFSEAFMLGESGRGRRGEDEPAMRALPELVTLGEDIEKLARQARPASSQADVQASQA
jgi:exopolysaccharide biosynthesis polyprenyl glycosylphosphotransferase